MANLIQDLKIQTPKETFEFNTSEPYKEVFTIRRKVDSTDSFTSLWSTGKTAGSTEFDEIKAFVVHNTSDSVVEVMTTLRTYQNTTSATLDTASGDAFYSYILRAGEYMYCPNTRQVGYNTKTSAANASTIDDDNGQTINSGNLFVDAVANLDAKIEDSDTEITVDDTDYFRVGDLIQVGNNDSATATKIEIMKITEINAGGVTGKLAVLRAQNGSTLVDGDAQTDSNNGAVSGANVYFPFFNALASKDKYTKVQTNEAGRYMSTNLLGYGRRDDARCFGIVPGSLSIKLYTKAYQELGLSGITAATDSGLAASTEYKFNITVDGGSTFSNLSFTTDATNTNFGGNNGIISKIQASLNTQFKTSGSNLFEKKVVVGIVNGDVRFTSGSRLSDSAILLAAPSSGTTPFGVGRIPAIGSIETAVSAGLPADLKFDFGGNTETENFSGFSYDNGHGNILSGEVRGTINYETGGLNLTGPANAELLISAKVKSAHAGGNHYGNFANTIKDLSARAINSRVKPVVEIVAFK